MTKLASLVAALFLSFPAFAHLEIGKYEGLSVHGVPCSLEVLAVRFDGPRHPLNERVDVRVDGRIWVLAHLPKVDLSRSQVLPDGERLTAVEGVAEGANAVILQMTHSDAYTGPTSLTVVHHDYDNPENTVQSVCSGLRKADGRDRSR